MEGGRVYKKDKDRKNIFFAPVRASYKKILSLVRNKKIYVTIDVDSFDPSVMPATGTPEPPEGSSGIGRWDFSVNYLSKKK